MQRKKYPRLIVVALIIITAFYLVLIRTPTHDSRSNSGPPIEIEPAPPRTPEPSDHPKSSRRRPTPEDHGFGAGLVACSSRYFSGWEEPEISACAIRTRNGYPEPDPRCTPGGINPSITPVVLRDHHWRTRSVRNCESSESEKHIAYRWYNIQKPRINSDRNQVSELDHLVPLELGGADGLGNIWPQCGPDGVALSDRFFKRKDHVENYLAEQVRDGRMSLNSAQRGIASDWTQYLPDAERWCRARGKC